MAQLPIFTAHNQLLLLCNHIPIMPSCPLIVDNFKDIVSVRAVRSISLKIRISLICCVSCKTFVYLYQIHNLLGQNPIFRNPSYVARDLIVSVVTEKQTVNRQ